MLILFEVSGFKNFEDTISIDFSDVRDYRFNQQCVSDNLLKKVIIYGKNSEGKSNFGLALFDLVSHLTSNNVSPGLYDQYLNADNQSGFAEFHYVFQFSSGTVDYRYRKNEKRELIFEKVCIDENELFRYSFQDDEDCDLSGLRKLMPTLNLAFRGNDSLLKYAVTNSALVSLEEDHPLFCMMNFVTHMLWFRSLDENRYIGYQSTSNNYYEFIFEDGRVKEFEELLHKAGIMEKLTVKENAEGKQVLYFQKARPIPFFRVASNGTKALYTFYYWKTMASSVSFMFIDEFDAFYHYELSELVVNILETMQSCQTVLTSHNTNLLSNRIMRPDCFFILSNGKIISFANATKRELREGHNLEKLYMSGEFDG